MRRIIRKEPRMNMMKTSTPSRWRSLPSVNREAFIDQLKDLVGRHEIYRIKGFLNVPGKPMRLALQGVGDRFDAYFDRAWREGEDRKGRLVFIGRKLKEANLEKELDGKVFRVACTV